MRRRTELTARRSPISPGSFRGDAGFTVTEMAVSIGIAAILTVVGVGAFRQYTESTAARKAAVQLAADVGLTRSLAIQRRENVSLVLDEAALTYEVRDTVGTVLMRRDFGPGTEVPLSSLNVNTGGDSLTFNSRGLLVGGSASIIVQRSSRSHQIDINVLGRAALN